MIEEAPKNQGRQGQTRRRWVDTGDHALSGYRHHQADLQDRAGHLAVRVPGMGIRKPVRRPGRAGHRAAGPGTGYHLVRHGRDLRFRAQRADLGPGTGSGPRAHLPRHEDLARVAGRAGGGAARRGQREPAGRPRPRSVPGAPAQPGDPGWHDHAWHARPAARRAGRRGRRQQLLAAALADRRGRTGQPGAEQPGPLQPGGPLPRARPAALRRRARPHGTRLQPAGPGAAIGPV